MCINTGNIHMYLTFNDKIMKHYDDIIHMETYHETQELKVGSGFGVGSIVPHVYIEEYFHS